MTNRLIILLGAYPLIGSLPEIRQNPVVRFYADVANGLARLPSVIPTTAPVVKDEIVMLREILRDDRVFADLESPDSDAVIVEQWHIGHLAYAMVHASYIVNEYEEHIRNLGKRLPSTRIEAWYVSIDTDKLLPSIQTQEYLEYLTKSEQLLRSFGIELATIDGDAPSVQITKRIKYLLDNA